MVLILTSVYGVYRGVDGGHSYLCLWRVQGVYRWCSFLLLFIMFIACAEGVDGAHSYLCLWRVQRV